MTNQTYNWKTPDNVNLFAQSWKPDTEIKAVVTLVHGFGEHSSRYTPYIDYFLKKGIAFVGFDHRGHGKSDGKRGTVKSYEAFMNDMDLVTEKTKELFPNLPHFIYGHSMGGNIAFNYLLRRKPKLSGGIITSPWFALTKDPNFLLKGMISFLKQIIPNLTIESGLEINYISTNANEVELYKTDALNHGKISFRLFNIITQSGSYAIKNSNQLEIPVLMFHGSADKITSPKASKKAADANPNLIEYTRWPDKYHELHNETNRAEIAASVIQWIEKHC